jgi:hypothetical protein
VLVGGGVSVGTGVGVSVAVGAGVGVSVGGSGVGVFVTAGVGVMVGMRVCSRASTRLGVFVGVGVRRLPASPGPQANRGVNIIRTPSKNRKNLLIKTKTLYILNLADYSINNDGHNRTKLDWGLP